MKKICPYCHYPNQQDATFCISCQEEISHVKPTEYTTNGTQNSSITHITESSRYMGYIPEEVTTFKWIFILIGLAIPLLNIMVIASILIISDNETLRNFSKASIIVTILGFILYFWIFLFTVAR